MRPVEAAWWISDEARTFAVAQREGKGCCRAIAAGFDPGLHAIDHRCSGLDQPGIADSGLPMNAVIEDLRLFRHARVHPTSDREAVFLAEETLKREQRDHDRFLPGW